MRRGAPLKSNPQTHRAWQERSRRNARKRQQADPKPRSPINPLYDDCFFAAFDPNHECDGALVRCHLVPEQFLRDTLGLNAEERWHRDWWVPGCGGPTGIGGHHGRFDSLQIDVPRAELPERLERLAERYPRVDSYLTRRYGRRAPLIDRVGVGS